MTSGSTIKSQLMLAINLPCHEDCYASGKIFYGCGASNGEFLRINATQTTIRLSNIIKVKAIACGNEISSVKQASLIRHVKILGSSTYDVNIDICSTLITEDLFEKNFDNSTNESNSKEWITKKWQYLWTLN